MGWSWKKTTKSKQKQTKDGAERKKKPRSKTFVLEEIISPSVVSCPIIPIDDSLAHIPGLELFTQEELVAAILGNNSVVDINNIDAESLFEDYFAKIDEYLAENPTEADAFDVDNLSTWPTLEALINPGQPTVEIPDFGGVVGTLPPPVTIPIDPPRNNYNKDYDFPLENQPLVGVIDTGFSGNNPDIDYSRITLGSDRLDNDNNPLLNSGEGNEHGTHVLGIIGATRDNGLGIDGINDNAPLWLGRTIGSGEWAESLREFVDDFRESGKKNGVANLSFDLTQTDSDGNVTTRYELTPEERVALEYARQNGVLIVTAAGNDGDVMSVLGQASQEFDNIITVGAADGENRAAYSSYGNGLDILAPGGTESNPLLSTVGDDLGKMAGTSVATAQVSGAASLVWAANPDLNYSQVKEILKSTAQDVQTPGWDEETGAGLLNIDGAVEQAKVTVAEEYKPVAWYAPETWSGEGIVTPGERAVATEFMGKYYDWSPYAIQSGDTLSGIAYRTMGGGTAPYYNFIAQKNGIANPNYIYVGQNILIPRLVAAPTPPAPVPPEKEEDLPTVPLPGEGKVPTDAGEFVETKVSNGVTTHYYTDGYLMVQPGGHQTWYAVGSGTGFVGITGVPSSPVKAFAVDNFFFQVHRGLDNRIATRYSSDGGNSWTDWIKTDIANEATYSQPVVTTLNGVVYQSHVGKDKQIYTRFSTDGNNWTEWEKAGVSNEATDFGMAMTALNGKLYQSHVGNDKRIYTRSSTDGKNWTGWEKADILREETHQAIAMTGLNGKLYQSHVGQDKRIYTRSSTHGINWSDWKNADIPKEETHQTIAMTGFNGKLYQSHIGKNKRVYTRSSTDGINWSSWKDENGSNEQAYGALRLEAFGNKLYQYYAGDNTYMYMRSSTDGENWTGWEEMGDARTPIVDNFFFQVHRALDNRIATRYSSDGGETWTDWVKADLENEATYSQPVVTTLNGVVYQSHVGKDKQIYTRSSIDGNNWSNWSSAGVSNEATDLGIAMTEFNGKLYQSHVGKDKQIYTRSSIDGKNWSDWSSPGVSNEATDLGIAMTELNGKLYQSHIGKDKRIYTRSSTDGKNWSEWKRANIPREETNSAVAMTAFNGKLYQSHIGNDKRVYTRSSQDGVNWSAWEKENVANEAAYGRLGLETFGNKLYQYHVGKDTYMYMRSSTDGKNWTGWEKMGDARTPIPKQEEENSGSDRWQHPLPGYPVTSEFGWRVINGVRGFHWGIDIGTNGTTPPVKAAKSGEVEEVGYHPNGWGNFVKVNHGQEFQTIYAHLSSVNVKKGQQVKAGDYIGNVGNTGFSFGNHLHFETRVYPFRWKTDNRNPRDYIQF